MLPSFLILGVQKGGTSSLYRWLVRHPHVLPARRKELHFFDREHDRGLRWYRGQFPGRLREGWHRVVRRRPVVTGEASPSYLPDPAVRDRVRAALPDARFVVLLRDPVERAWSHHRHFVRRGRPVPPFAEAVERERRDDLAGRRRPEDARGYLGRGRYAEQLERWFEVFPREQFLVLRSEDVFASPAEHVRRVVDFLGLAPLDPTRWVGEFDVWNRGLSLDLDPDTRRVLEDYFAPHEDRLVALLGPTFRWRRGTSRATSGSMARS
ncbi:MAG: sulfotransferase [Planctomycetes bacterium]|nr:sulfotransferase [Planctomycetota bacterium]